MSRVFKRICGRLIVCFLPLLCASCLTMSVPQGTKVERSPKATADIKLSKTQPLVDVWELLYQVDDRGNEKQPKKNTKTLIEFTSKGRVFFNELDKRTLDSIKSHAAHYKTSGQILTITDDKGNKDAWPYSLTGDTLIISIPELNKKFYCRRHR